MTQRKNQIFQLSLTEMAFTITFLLLLLLGYIVFKEQTDRETAEGALARVQSAEQAAAALDAAKSSMAAVLSRSGASNPDAVISKLLATEEIRKERDQLKRRAEDLDSKLTALTELQKELVDVSKFEREGYVKERVASALALESQIREAFSAAPREANTEPIKASSKLKDEKKEVLEKVKQAIEMTNQLKVELKSKMDLDIMSGQPSQAIKDVVNAAKSFSELSKQSGSPEQIRKENSDLRGQVAFLKNRLEARGGRDYPPCWADEKTGKVEFLFSVEVRPSGVAVTPAWPNHRESDARALPAISQVLGGSPHTYPSFISTLQGIFNLSQSQQCRHYVLLKSAIAEAVESDRARLLVENYFYRVEVRR